MPTRTLYHIHGMTGWDGSDAVTGRLSGLEGVLHVQTDIVAGTAMVTSERPLPPERVREALRETGFTAADRPAETLPQQAVAPAWFVGGLAAALLAGFALANAVRPAVPAETAEQPAPTAGTGVHAHGAPGGQVTGLSASVGGFTLVPTQTVVPGTGEQRLSFVIRDASGGAVNGFATVHERPMHLILIRRDLSGFQHLHPQMAPDGTWTYTADFGQPGAWHAYADFTIVRSSGAEVALTLGYDITVPGDQRPVPLPAAATSTTVDGGYLVTLQRTAAQIRFQVGPQATLQPYLGASGHLVVVRQADLAYVHAHAITAGAEGTADFGVTLPGAGTYRAYFQFQIDGRVRTAEFTIEGGL